MEKESIIPEHNDKEIVENTTDLAQRNYQKQDEPKVQPLCTVRFNAKEDNHDAKGPGFTAAEMDVVKILGTLTTTNRKADKTVTTNDEGDKTKHQNSGAFAHITTVADNNIQNFKTSVPGQLGEDVSKNVSQQPTQKTHTIVEILTG